PVGSLPPSKPLTGPALGLRAGCVVAPLQYRAGHRRQGDAHGISPSSSFHEIATLAAAGWSIPAALVASVASWQRALRTATMRPAPRTAEESAADERRDAHPVRHRTRRPECHRATLAAGLRGAAPSRGTEVGA